jgi:hypothetical protein
MIFARRVFTVAGVYGVLVLLPMLFLEDAVARRAPPAFTHPEFYYGFVGVALAWQLVFLLVGRDPARLRPVMLPAVLEKVVWGVGVCALTQGTDRPLFPWRGGDRPVLATLFVVAWRKTGPSDPGRFPS